MAELVDWLDLGVSSRRP